MPQEDPRRTVQPLKSTSPRRIYQSTYLPLNFDPISSNIFAAYNFRRVQFAWCADTPQLLDRARASCSGKLVFVERQRFNIGEFYARHNVIERSV